MKNRLESSLNKSQSSRAFSSTFHSAAVQMWQQLETFQRIVLGGHLEIYVERALRSCGSVMDLDQATSTIDKIGQQLNLDRSKFSSMELKLFSTYEKILKKEKRIDLNQICRIVILGMRSGKIRPLNETLGITHIVADEFQDSDDLQYQFLLEHAKHGVNIFVVGDDDQSIYGFRNANGVDNFRNLQADLSAKAYSLKVCYRCPPAILEVANNLIEYNEERIPKQLKSHLEVGGKVECKGYLDEDDQLQKIVEMILANPQRWAVLARTNKEINGIELELAKHKVKVKRLGGKSFFDSPDVIAYVKLMWMLFNQKHWYIPDFLAYMHESEIIIDTAKDMIDAGLNFDNILTSLKQSGSLGIHTQAIIQYYHHQQVPQGLDRKGIAEYQRQLISMLTAQRRMNSAGVIGAIADIITRTATNLGSFKAAVDQFHERISGIKSKQAPKISDDEVVIATLHGSKGLEFSKVAILSCQDERIPQPDKDGLGLKHWEEERRLFYVGITRAEEYLHLGFFKKKIAFLQEAMRERADKALEMMESDCGHGNVDHVAELAFLRSSNGE
jgi:superfamily I DNA/RNA helicase